MKNVNNNEKASIYLHVLRRWWWLPVMLALVSGGVTYLGTRALLKPEYGAQFTISITSQQGVTPTDLAHDANWIATDMSSPATLNRVATNFLQSPPSSRPPTMSQDTYAARQKIYTISEGPTGRPLLDRPALYRVSCTADSTDHWVTCSTTSRYPASAAGVLTALADAYIPHLANATNASDQRQITGYKNQINADQVQVARDNTELSILAAQGKQSTPKYQTLTSEVSVLQSSVQQLYLAKRSVLDTQHQDRETLNITSAPSFVPNQVGPHSMRDAFLGAIVGLGMAAALIVLLEYLDDSFRTSDEVATSTGLSLLGAVRRYEGPADEMGLVAAKMPRTAIAEAYRVARANIQFMSVSGNIKILLITSARDGEGKTTTANNLATTFALAGQRVLLIDSDLRRPGLTRMMNMKDMPGLSTALVDPGVNVIQATDVVGLSMVPSGPIPPNPAELLGSQRMRDWVEEVARRYDILILDTPPILSVADTRVLSTLADGVVLVLDPNLTTRRMVKGARMAIENVGARVLGIVLNRDTMRGEGYYYNYYYYERAYRDDVEPSTRR